MTAPTLLAVPNVSEGRDAQVVQEIADAFAGADSRATGAVRLLDVHSDADHDRSVFTLAGAQGPLADALLAGARVALERIDVMRPREPPRQHPHVGALDIAPIVYPDEQSRGAACAEALSLGDRIGEELLVPVFVYGELSGRPPRTRSQLRRGGVAGLAAKIAAGEGAGGSLRPDFGPPRMHPTGGAVLLAAREPLVAFNLVLAEPATLADARAIASSLREGGADGLPGVRAIAVELGGGAAQVSMNIERPLELPLAAVVEAVAMLAPVATAELVGLAPAAALEGFPDDVELVGFDPERSLIENALRA
jgi:glutamate formiminotransferase